MSGNLVASYCPVYAPFFSIIGSVAAVAFTALGAAYGTAKCSVGICAVGVSNPDLIMKSMLPVVMAGVIGIYGVIVAVIQIPEAKPAMALSTAMSHFGGGLSVGLAGLAAGCAIGVVGDVGVRGSSQQKKLFMGMMIILILSEVLALYGFIISMVMYTNSGNYTCDKLAA